MLQKRKGTAFMTTSIYKSEAIRSIAQGALTNSKHWERFIEGVYPSHIEYGRDCFLFDTRGKRYVDYICGLGTNLFGYGNPAIIDEMMKYIYYGGCHSLPTSMETDVAFTVKSIFPFIEKVKFLNDGSSACTAATLISRAYTARDLVLSAGYHGWHNEFVSLTEPANGVCRNLKANISKFEGLDKIDDPTKVACIILEPVELDDSKERIEFLNALREYCNKHGIVLIFDEVITGLRYPSLAVSNHYGIYPDLICMSKALANGEKVAVLGGKKELMDNDYFCSGTYHGHVQSLAALNKTLKLAKHNPTYNVKELNERTKVFIKSLNEMTEPHFRIVGWGARGAFQGDMSYIARFWQEMCKAGFLFGPSFFSNYPLLDQFDKTLKIASSIMTSGLKNVVLEGPLPTSPFSQKLRKD